MSSPNQVSLHQKLKALHQAFPRPTNLKSLAQAFKLSPFEQDILILCMGVEVNTEWSKLCGVSGNDPASPTFGLALTLFENAHTDAITPAAPLRKWQLIHLGQAMTITQSPLKIDEEIFHYLMENSYPNPQLSTILRPVLNSDGLLIQTQEFLLQHLVETWQNDHPTLEICGQQRKVRHGLAAALCKANQFDLWLLPATLLPLEILNFTEFLRLLERHARLHPSTLLLDIDNFQDLETRRKYIVVELLNRCPTPLIISSDSPFPPQDPAILRFDTVRPSPTQQAALWTNALKHIDAQICNSVIAEIAHTFVLSASQIAAISETTQGKTYSSANDLRCVLWQACRQAARPHLNDLAERVSTRLTWDDLVFPEAITQQLQSIVAAVRQRSQVYQDWGFAQPEDRGLGMIALFAGQSGTGKTTAAEIIARELELDCYRIDLSNIVNKYIGETEKNLKRVFDAAQGSGAMLLFDEADAVFGMRGEVKEARDRYANQEVSYLLQRLETYPGVVILTSNLKESIDRAFKRRLRYLVEFPTPSTAERKEIWQQVFPPKVPTQDLHYRRLAELQVTGANIRNIALNAAFLAAEMGEPITMGLLERATRAEYKKLGRSLSSTESAAIRMKKMP